MNTVIPEYSAEIIKKLEQNGAEAYLVGGCVRDFLLGREVNDYDITTNAIPEDVKKFLAPMHVIDTGIKHGTVTAVTAGGNVEITTFRTESGYTDGRHPGKVEFVGDLRSDLMRRDFTVNALAYNPNRGLFDFFGGTEDIKNKLIRCVGKAELRFDEDALRILRAVRFCSVLGFDTEPETECAVHTMRGNLEKISRERIKSELEKTICGINADKTVRKFSDVINSAFGTDVINSKTDLFDKLPPIPDIRFAALLYGNGELIRTLKCEKALSHTVEWLDKNRNFSPKSKYELKLFISENGYENTAKLATLRRDTALLKSISEIRAENPCLNLSQLAVNGTDVISRGLSGEKTGRIMKELLSMVIEGKLKNEREELLKYVASEIKRM